MGGSDLQETGAASRLYFILTAHRPVELLQDNFRPWQPSVECKDLVVVRPFRGRGLQHVV